MQPSTIVSSQLTGRFQLRPRLRAAAVHLALSVLVAGLAGLLVFALWYPYPYRDVSGGRELFMLIVSVDIVIGPLITFTVFNRAKPLAELKRDLAVVGLLQLAALCYGLWTLHLARPVHMVFEYDRFRVVHRIDIPAELESRAPPGIQVAPWTGPTPLSTRAFRNEGERMEMTLAALQGVQLGARPDLWEPYASGKQRILAAARPVSDLRRRFAAQAQSIDDAVGRSGRDAGSLSYLPMVARKAEAWTVLLDAKTAEIVGFLPLDSF